MHDKRSGPAWTYSHKFHILVRTKFPLSLAPAKLKKSCLGSCLSLLCLLQSQWIIRFLKIVIMFEKCIPILLLNKHATYPHYFASLHCTSWFIGFTRPWLWSTHIKTIIIIINVFTYDTGKIPRWQELKLIQIVGGREGGRDIMPCLASLCKLMYKR